MEVLVVGLIVSLVAALVWFGLKAIEEQEKRRAEKFPPLPPVLPTPVAPEKEERVIAASPEKKATKKSAPKTKKTAK